MSADGSIGWRHPGHAQRVFLGLVLGIAAGAVASCGPPPAAPPPPEPAPAEPAPAPAAAPGPVWFRDVTAASGVVFTYRNGEEADQFSILESLGGGVALIDYDGDGRLDLFFTGGGYFDGPAKAEVRGHPCRLYRNLGNFRFEDVTARAGLGAVSWWYTHGAAVADYDRDGWPDLVVSGYGRLAVFHNEPDGTGGRTFVDRTAQLGIRDESWTTGVGWADLDGDGFPDLYVCRYCDWSPANNLPCRGQAPDVDRDICPPHRYRTMTHEVYRNDRGARFRPAAKDLGMAPDGYGLGVLLADLNGDGRPDVYVANDMSPNLLYLNRGGKLEESGLLAGVALDDTGRTPASMGVVAGDYDGTGRPALFITTFQRELPSLYRNLGKERFYYQSVAAGFGALGRTYVGWGAGMLDADNDGWEDVVTVNGHLFRRPSGAPLKQPLLVLRNVERAGQRVFRDTHQTAAPPAIGRGMAVGDLDNDGWPDLVISNTNGPAVLLRNEARATAPGAHWLGVKLVGRDRRDVVGSTVTVETAARKVTRFVQGGGSYLSANDSRCLFGLGADPGACRVVVRWSWGETQAWQNVQPGAYYELVEGGSAPRRIAP